MVNVPGSGEQIEVNPDHLELLSQSLRSPSAHNVQPWLIRPLDDGHTYELYCDKGPNIPEDPGDKDAYLTMGTFVETLVLQAPNHGLEASVAPVLSHSDEALFIARVTMDDSVEGPTDSLSQWIDKRATNRNRYFEDPLPPELEENLTELGNAVVDPETLGDIVEEASIKSWADPQYVHDLQMWFRRNENAPDGLTASCLHLGRMSVAALELTFRRGSIQSALWGRLLSSGEVGMFRSAPRAAVLGADDMEPATLFDAGRRLLRSWVTITAAGYSYQPYSVAVDQQSTIPKVAEASGVDVPVALYRIGKATEFARPSNRRPLGSVLIP